MFYVVAALILGTILVLAGRGRRTGRVLNLRVGALVFAALATAGAIVSALELRWFFAAPLAVLSAWLWSKLVVRRPLPGGPKIETMTDQRARALLGVNAQAGVEEIQAAYLRLIRAVHPDRGGTSGLAAELNAARDRLLRR